MNEEYVQQPIGEGAQRERQSSPQGSYGWTRVSEANAGSESNFQAGAEPVGTEYTGTRRDRMDSETMNNEPNNSGSNNGGSNNGGTSTVTGTQSQTATHSPNMLYRHPSQKVVGGVCGGLADFLGWDPVLVRILWVVATIATGGGGFLAYAALWVMLPVGTVSGGQERPPAIEMNDRNLRTAAYLLIGLGILWFLSNVGILPWMWSGFWSVVGLLFWPALLIGAGFLLLNRNGNADWRTTLRTNFQDASDRVRSTFSNRAPSSGEVKSGLKSARQRIPFKRSQQDRILMGVCGGIGQRFGIEPNLVRLIWVAFSIGSIGTGALLYLALGLLVPEANGANGQHSESYDDSQDVPVVNGNAGNGGAANGNPVL